MLVPAPSHAPVHVGRRQVVSAERQVRPTLELVRAMARYGLGDARELLVRTTRVPKSAWAKPGERIAPETHYHSMSISSSACLPFETPRKITVVDDVIATGGTLYACALRLMRAYPEAEVRAFAAVRTRSRLNQVTRIIDPVMDGTISLDDSGSPKRQP